MMAAVALSPIQSDALRELCNVCSGRAADALSRLIGERPVELGLPDELPHGDVASHLGGADAKVVGARVELAGPLRGELWLVLAERDAAELSGLLEEQGQREVAVWALYETANIVASACLNALYALTRLTVVPSVPEVLVGEAEKVVARLPRASDAPIIVTELALREPKVRAKLLFAPHAESVAPLLKAMGLR